MTTKRDEPGARHGTSPVPDGPGARSGVRDGARAVRETPIAGRVGNVRRLPRALVLALAVSAIVACSSDPPPAPAAAAGTAEGHAQRGGTAVVGNISDVDAWNEYVSEQSFAVRVLRRMYLELARESGAADALGESFEPELAESWSFSDDGLALTFRLREATWSDGRPITAEDVRFTWQAQRDPGVPWIAADSKARITDVEVVDDRTVTFRFDGRYPYQLSDAVTGGILPRHVFGEVPFAGWKTHDWSGARVVSGPFVLERHAPSHEIVLVRNPRYFREGHPFLDRVVIRIVPDIGSLVTQLMAGEIDYVEGVPPRDAERLDHDPGVEILAFDYPQYDFLGWNAARPPLDRPEVRRALTMAIDREALVEELLHGYGVVSHGPVPSWWWGAASDLEAVPHDPERAREVLAAAGHGPGGKTLRLELLTNAGNRVREDMLVKIQEQLARVGVEAVIRPYEMQTMRQKVTAGEYDGYLGGWALFGKVDLRSPFGSASIPPDGMNVVRYRSTEVDRLLDELDLAATKAEMKPALEGIQRRIREDQPYTFLYELRRIAAHRPRLRGVRIVTPFDTLAALDRFWIEE
jgi:peptide/nickel transport system substrate-binding protein